MFEPESRVTPEIPASGLAGNAEPLERRFAGFGDRAAKFVRSLQTLSLYHGDLGGRAAEPTVRVVRSAFGKWAPDILLVLAPRQRTGFGELRQLLPKISARVLSGKLKALEAAGLVSRKVVPARPPRPEYALTERAQALVQATTPVLTYLKSTSARSSRRGLPEEPRGPVQLP